MSEVRICTNCSHKNDINNLECEKCGFDLSFVIPIDEREIQDNTSNNGSSEQKNECRESHKLKLVSADNQVNIDITDELIIGRDGVNSDYFERSNYVSRKHAIFYIENSETFVFDVSTNGTFLNDKKLPKLSKVPIHTSDRISFADVVFEVTNAD